MVGVRFLGFNPFGYRVMDAVVDVLVVTMIYVLGQRLFRSRSVGFLAAFFASLEGVLLVESRAGLINIFAVLFSLVAYYLFLRKGSEDLNKRPWPYLASAGGLYGRSGGCQWIGAASFGIIWAVYFIARLNRRWSWPGLRIASNETTEEIAGMHPTLVLVLCFLLPLLVYASTFIVHVNQNPEYGFVELHKQMFGYHAHLQEGYGYASSWWSWSLLQRPVNYFWEVNQDHQTVQIILNLGNPILWWLGFGCDFVCHLGCAISGRLLARGFSGNGHRNHRLRNLLLSLLDWAPDSTRRILPENVVVQLDLETV